MHAPTCTSYLPTTTSNIPTGEISTVTNTRYDFTSPRLLHEENFQGYDDYLISSSAAADDELKLLVSLKEPSSTWSLHVHSNQPGFQVYTGNGFPPESGEGFAQFGSVAIEPSEFIDAPNQTEFPSTLLDVGQTRTQIIQYQFSRTPSS